MLTTAIDLAKLVNTAVRDPLLKLQDLDPKLAETGNTLAAELAICLGEAHLSRGRARILRLLEAVGHCQKLLLVVRRALMSGHLQVAELGGLVQLVNRLLAFTEEQGCEWLAHQHDLALTRAEARRNRAMRF